MGIQHLWGKTGKDASGTLTHWLPTAQHLADTAAVGELIWDRFLPQATKDLLAGHIGSHQRARTLIVTLCGTHDIGKATCSFVEKDAFLADRARDAGYPIPNPVPSAKELPHNWAGHVYVENFLKDAGFDPLTATSVAVVVGGHHGSPPTDGEISAAKHLTAAMGRGTWEDARDDMFSPYQLRLLNSTPGGGLHHTGQILISAIVILADWIASNTDALPLLDLATIPPSGYDYAAAAKSRAEAGWVALKMPSACTIPPLPPDWRDHFADMFGFPAGALPNGLQESIVDMLTGKAEPGIFIVEAPMGIGKTEGALLGARIIAAALNLGGMTFALPTRATGNAIYSRMIPFINDLIKDSSGDQPFRLAHAKAWLNDEFTAMPRHRFEISCGARASTHSWLSGRKRDLLNPFTVSTIDQVLFAGQKQRHVVLRLLGLVGKVLIIDEAHAYDTYMTQYLTKVLRWCGEFGVPVIILSATLPPEQRQKLIDAYLPPPPPTGPSWKKVAAAAAAPPVVGYPRLEWASITGFREVRVLPSGPDTTVKVQHLADDYDALARCLDDRLSDGGCAAVVVNTVRRARETAEFLTDRFGPSVVMIAHSRYVAADREALDKKLLELFGKSGKRPDRMIVVATQVVEQSLDVDFDLLISDIAPMDLLLQRAGRLHRHMWRSRPSKVSEPVLIIRGVVDWGASVPAPVLPKPGGRGRNPSYRGVYSDLLLLRTLWELNGKTEIHLPSDIEPSVRRVYDVATPIPDPVWWVQEHALLGEHARVQADKEARANVHGLSLPVPGMTLMNWLEVPADSDRARVRDGDDTLEVTLLRRDGSGRIGLMPWLDQPSVDLAAAVDLPWADVKRLNRSTVVLPDYLSTQVIKDRLVAAAPASFTATQALKKNIALILDVDGEGWAGRRHLTYTRKYGLADD